MPSASPPLGILMLDTSFERPVGDVGNLATWRMPVLIRRVRGATARKVVGGDDADLLDAFVAAGEALVRDGAIALTTSCGFLALRQQALAARLPVPVATSSLLQIPMIERTLPRGGRVGVITYDAAALTGAHFEAVGANPATPLVGLPAGGAFRGLIEGGRPYHRAALAEEVTASVERLIAATPGIAAIVFECTNLPPFSALVRRAFGLPVYDIVTMGHWFYAGIAARDLD